MTRLQCKIQPGLFSREKLVRFKSADGDEYTALVDQSLISGETVGVITVASSGARTLIAIPSDGARVWVQSSLLNTA